MTTFKLNGFTITVFTGTNKKMFIDDINGKEIWSHKFTGCPIEQANWIISNQ